MKKVRGGSILNNRSKARLKLAVISTSAVLLGVGGIIHAGAPALTGTLPAPLPLFPANNWWNLDISAAPVDTRSAAFISFIGPARGLHPDFGAEDPPNSATIYGFPYIVVDGSQPKQTVYFDNGNSSYPDDSDGVDHTTGQSFPFYPIPDEAKTQAHWVEGGWPGNTDHRDTDRHILIVDRDNRHLYELWNCFYDGARWHAGSGAFFDMKTNNRRPDGWTSSDAAGLAILPGLIRYDEVYGPDEIRHAFRFTVRATNSFYVYPASHVAGSNGSALPMGARLRLKAGVDISKFQSATQKIFRAMKKYGLIVADNGSDMYVSGTYDHRWVNGAFNADFSAIKASDFEVVQLGYKPDSQTLFPHLAVGGGYTTVFSLTNTGATPSTGSLVITDGSGAPLNVAASGAGISSTGGSSLPISIPSGATSIFSVNQTDDASPTRAGWARLQTSGGVISGVATFQYSASGKLLTLAGVFASAPAASVTIPVDNDDSQQRYTGFAIANPSAESISLVLEVIDEGGKTSSTVRPPALNPLPPNGQNATFLHQADASTLTFRGSVRITADGGKQFVAVALTLTQGLYAAIPVISTP